MLVSFLLMAFISCATGFLQRYPLRYQQSSLQAAKGFGTPTNNVESLLAVLQPTRNGFHRKLEGQYSVLLSQRSEVFEKMKAERMDQEFAIHDIYARLSNSDTFWFIGKVGHYPNVTMNEAFFAVEVMLIEYAKTLRPAELGHPAASIHDVELWHAPGNSEMLVAQNKQNLLRVFFPPGKVKLVSYKSIGYEPEVYQSGEIGFRCKRDELGQPIAAPFDVNMGSPNDLVGKIDVTKAMQQL